MPIPLIAYLAAAGAGLYLVFRKPTAPAGAAATTAAGADPNAISAALALGHAARPINASDLLAAPAAPGLTFSKTSPPEFKGTLTDADVAQILPGDVMTVDVGAAGIQLAEIPSGNMLFKVTAPMNMTTHTIAVTSIDPRIPSTGAVVTVPQKAITDVVAGGADMSKIIAGMSQPK